MSSILLHWVIFLPDDDDNVELKLLQKDGSFGWYYSVSKNLFSSAETALEIYRATADKVVSRRLILSEIKVSPLELSTTCREVCEDRPFNVVVRNCQNFVCEVVQRLCEDKGIDSEVIFERMKNEGLVPLNRKMGRKEKK